MPNNNNNIFGLKNLPKNVAPAANAVPQANLLGLNANAIPPAPHAPAAPAALPANLEELMPPFDTAFFLDNDSKYIGQVRACDSSEGKIKAHKVAGSDYLMGVGLESDAMTRHLENLTEGGRAFGNMIVGYIAFLAKNYPGFLREEMIDEGSGIRAEDVRALREWVERNTGKRMVVLFDWDRTLTTIEGGFYTANSFAEMIKTLASFVDTSGLTVENMVEYYVGGMERLTMLQEMFDFLYSKNVTIYILTNNRVCIDHPKMLTQLANVLTRNRQVHLICSAAHDHNKQRAILATEKVRHLCPMRGGKRSKHTHKRKGRGKKRSTRRR
jgi:hypothetical protein